MHVVSFVDGINLAALREAHVGVRQAEGANAGIQREAVDAVPGSDHQHGAGAVDDIARGDLFAAGLQEILQGDGCAHRTDAAVNAENGAHGDVHVHVGRAVQGVHEDDVLGFVVGFVVKSNEVFQFLGGHSANLAHRAERPNKRVVREDVQLHLVFALDVFRTGQTQNIGQPGLVDFAVDDLSRQAYRR